MIQLSAGDLTLFRVMRAERGMRLIYRDTPKGRVWYVGFSQYDADRDAAVRFHPYDPTLRSVTSELA